MTEHPTLLFCLPHAGGSIFFYHPLKKFLPDWLQMVSVELPGRGSRSQEPLMDDLEQMRNDVAEKIQTRLNADNNPRYVIFGHSLGGLLAFLLAYVLPNPPCRLILSSPSGILFRPANSFPIDQNVSPKEFLKKLQTLGGLSDDILASKELMDYFVPILRSDFTAMSNWNPVPTMPLSIPLSLLHGEEEKRDWEHWAAKTTGSFHMTTFSGGHFYLANHWQDMAKTIAQACAENDG